MYIFKTIKDKLLKNDFFYVKVVSPHIGDVCHRLLKVAFAFLVVVESRPLEA